MNQVSQSGLDIELGAYDDGLTVIGSGIMMQAQLGMIPSWQLLSDPGLNIKLNDHVQFPPGFTQSTIQPVGSYYGVARIAQPTLNGPVMSRVKRFFSIGVGCCDGGNVPDACCGGRTASMHGLGNSVVDWMYAHPGALVIGGLGLLATAGLVLKRRKRR